MTDKNKIETLTNLLKEILSEGQEIDSAEFPFVIIKGDIEGKGIIWTGRGHNKQFIFNTKPDRFFVSESIDLAREKSISINSIKILDEKELGPSVIKSNLREVGRLKGLLVDGGMRVNDYLIYDSNTDRLGIGTEEPKAALSIADQNIELIFGASEPNKASIGTYNSADLELITDNTKRITIEAGGNIILGNPVNGEVKVSILGKLAVNVSNPDPRSALHVNGAIKFNDKLHLNGNEPPSSGAFNEGDIVWNTYPQPNKFVGWVCTISGNPGVWNGFGRIE